MIYLRAVRTKELPPPEEGFPFSLPLIRELDEIIFESPVTFLSGENGTGKSTILEGIAAAARSITIGAVAVEHDLELEAGPAARLLPRADLVQADPPRLLHAGGRRAQLRIEHGASATRAPGGSGSHSGRVRLLRSDAGRRGAPRTIQGAQSALRRGPERPVTRRELHAHLRQAVRPRWALSARRAGHRALAATTARPPRDDHGFVKVDAQFIIATTRRS